MNRILNFQRNSDDRLDIIAIKILLQKSKMVWKQEIESSFKYVYLFWKSFNILSVSTSNWTFHNETQVWIIQITKPFVAFSFQEGLVTLEYKFIPRKLIQENPLWDPGPFDSLRLATVPSNLWHREIRFGCVSSDSVIREIGDDL